MIELGWDIIFPIVLSLCVPRGFMNREQKQHQGRYTLLNTITSHPASSRDDGTGQGSTQD